MDSKGIVKKPDTVYRSDIFQLDLVYQNILLFTGIFLSFAENLNNLLFKKRIFNIAKVFHFREKKI